MKPVLHAPIDAQSARLFSRDEDVERAKNAAFRLLAARSRSRAELTDRLRGKGFSGKAIRETLEALERLGMLDDRAFARQWATRRMETRPAGRRALERELREKGVSADLIQETLDETLAGRDPAAEALALLRNRAFRYQTLERERALGRMYGLLGRRGFGVEVARAAARRMWLEIERNRIESQPGPGEGSTTPLTS
jgi:regulatory protein